MKFDWKMHENSLFAVLLRSPWWMSIAVAAAIAIIAQYFLPIAYAVIVGAPFIVIGGMAGWRQLQMPSADRVSATVEAVRAMAWPEFSAAIEAAFRADGYTVNRLQDATADFEATKGYRTALIACKRWKAARTGIEPLRDLVAAKEKREAHECVYIVAGEISDNARAFAAQNKIRLIYDLSLAQLLPKVGRG